MLRRLYALIPLLCLLALAGAVALYVRRLRRQGSAVPKSTFAWSGVFALALVGLGLLDFARLVEGDGMTFALASFAAMAGGMLALARQSSFAAFRRLDGQEGHGRIVGEVARAMRDVVALVVATVAAFLALELPYNIYLLPTNPVAAAYQAFVIFAGLLVLYLLSQRRGVGPAVGVGALALVGVAEYFVIKFKGTSIAAADLFALGTAAAVSDTYVYSVNARVLLGITAALVGICALSFVAPSHPASRRARLANLGANLGVGAACLVALALLLTQVNLKLTFDIWPDYWRSVQQHSENGFLSTFVTEAQNLPIEVPEGYSNEEADQLVAQYAARYDETTGASEARQAATAQFDETRPNVVVVMDEAFSDLSIYDGLGCGYAGPEFWNGEFRDSSIAGGAMYTSVLGTGTCNTEFEFLSNEAMMFVGDGKLVYPMYDLSGIDSVPRQFKGLGYGTTAIHPNLASNWSRDRVYPELGFDRFYDIDDFGGAPTFHSGVTDGATFDKCLDVLEQGEGPQFVFAVTMQNHSAYTQNNIPSDRLTNYQPQGAAAAGDTAQLNEYLSCIQASDQDLEAFVAQLSQLDEPTILVVFGDHQPALSQTYNDALFPNEEATAHAARTYQTTYRVWANYDVAGTERGGAQLDVSAPNLSALMLSLTGAPLTDYQKAMLAYREEIPATYAYGYQGPDGVWYPNYWADGPYWDAYQALHRMQYRHFGAVVD